MAAPSAANIQRLAGSYLVWNPSDLGDNSGATPAFGGTILDTVRDIEFEPNIIYREIFNEYAGAVTGRIYCGEKPIIRAVLRHHGADMITQVAANANASGSQGVAFRFWPTASSGAVRAGVDLFDNANQVMIVPRATTAHPFVLMHLAVPTISERARKQYQWGIEYGLEVEFHGVISGAGKVYEDARLANIAL